MIQQQPLTGNPLPQVSTISWNRTGGQGGTGSDSVDPTTFRFVPNVLLVPVSPHEPATNVLILGEVSEAAGTP
jgi:hypothetical protein